MDSNAVWVTVEINADGRIGLMTEYGEGAEGYAEAVIACTLEPGQMLMTKAHYQTLTFVEVVPAPAKTVEQLAGERDWRIWQEVEPVDADDLIGGITIEAPGESSGATHEGHEPECGYPQYLCSCEHPPKGTVHIIE